MSNTIYKYPFEIGDDVTISMPRGATVLSVQMQGETPTMWAIVDPKAPIEARRFRIFGTGHPVPSVFGIGNFVATFQQGPFVWHMFDDRAKAGG